MAKKGGGRNRGKKKPKNRNKPKVDVRADADLRFIPTHVENWIAGIPEAGQALIDLGRDASYTVLQIATDTKNEELAEFGRKLAAIPPQIESNLDALREFSVLEHVTRERDSASTPKESTGYEINGGAIAFFDPKLLMENLVHHGRPRKDPSRLLNGDLAWYGLWSADAISVRFVDGLPPEGSPSARLRVRVESGAMFVGPPEASDGPRLGAVRKNPFGTSVDEYLDRGLFLKMKPGTYAVYAQRMPDDALTVYFAKDREAAKKDVLDVDRMHDIPVFVDEATTA